MLTTAFASEAILVSGNFTKVDYCLYLACFGKNAESAKAKVIKFFFFPDTNGNLTKK